MADFIITSLQSWDASLGGNAKDIAFELSYQHRVLYVNTYSSKRGIGIELVKVQNNLWILNFHLPLLPVNWIPDGFLFDIVNRYNNYRIFKAINRYAATLQFKDAIHFCDNDVYRSFYALEFLHASLFIYYRRDNLHPISYWKPHIGRLEPKLISKSDMVMCNSAELAEYVSKFTPESCIHNIGQGVNLFAYQFGQQYELPEDCATLSHPIIGYTGVLFSSRLDIELLYKLAFSHPEYSFLFVGKRDNLFKEHPLQALPNVRFTGPRPMNLMPAYIQAMDVCLNPQAINEITIGNYPRKVDEYLAMGKPVVATRTRTMEMFKDYVYLCSNADEYLSAIDDAIKSNNSDLIQKRIAFAQTHSWANCIEKITKAIKNHTPEIAK